MYIISKTKDYYDSAVGMGIDKSIVYVREEKIEDDRTKFPVPFKEDYTHWSKDKNAFHRLNGPIKNESIYSSSSPFIVGFCGKLYIGWKFYRDMGINVFPSTETIITYDLQFIKKEMKDYHWNGRLQDHLRDVSLYNPSDLFASINAPIFVYDTDHQSGRNKKVFIINPTLKDYDFYKLMDSYTAFQEIQMYLGGVLTSGENNITEVEDKYKITQHGFDKYSFRRIKANGKKRPQSSRG